MKYILFSILLFSSHITFACEYLDGHWKSDKFKSLEFNNSLEEIPPRSIKLFKQMFGVQEVIYDGKTAHFLEAPTIELNIKGKKYPFDFIEAKITLKITECSPEKVVLDNIDDILENTRKGQINFENSDLYWVSPFGPWREYFVRIK